MIREIPRRFQYKSIFPRISWMYCELCGREFRLEPGWKINYTRPDERNWGYHCVCGRCKPSKEDIDEYVDFISR